VRGLEGILNPRRGLKQLTAAFMRCDFVAAATTPVLIENEWAEESQEEQNQ
jgi:hypothetical protein